MKYRIRPSRKLHLPHPTQSYRLRASDSLRRHKDKKESIAFSTLFEVGALPEGKRPRKHPLRAISAFFKKLTTILALPFLWLAARIRSRKKNAKPSPLPMLSGALCAALLVTSLSGGAVLLSLVLGYQTETVSVTVPSFVGKEPHAVEADSDRFNLILQYETNPEVEAGLVISQSPRAGVTRRVAAENGYCNIVLTVSRENEPYQLADLTGLSERDAALALKNEGISYTLREETSAKSAGTVLGTLPEEGTALSPGDSVILRVSKGQKLVRAYVPDLMGLSESDALARLKNAGLTVGEVFYRTSEEPRGTVIDQEHEPYALVEAHSTVSFTVSLGDRYSIRTVPDLYGMSTEDAATKLREYGLIIGERYSVGNAAPKGTVITQSPLPGTPITSATYAVDLYVSS